MDLVDYVSSSGGSGYPPESGGSECPPESGGLYTNVMPDVAEHIYLINGETYIAVMTEGAPSYVLKKEESS